MSLWSMSDYLGAIADGVSTPVDIPKDDAGKPVAADSPPPKADRCVDFDDPF